MARLGSMSYVFIVGIVSAFGLSGFWILWDPFVSSWFDSASWGSTTTVGSNALTWYSELWGIIMFLVLIGIMFMFWIRSRQSRGRGL